jgi:ADP-heptose:LPS heptosyltransferase
MGLKNVEKWGKTLLIQLVGIFVKKERLAKQNIDLARVRKILLVRQDKRLGNLVLTLPLVFAIRRTFPQIHITYLADEKFASVLEMCPEIDEVFVLKKIQLWNPFKLLSINRKIKKSNFDLALDLSDENNFSFRNAFLTYISRAPIRLGYQKAQNIGFLNLEVPIIYKERHVVERHLDLWRFLAENVPTPEFIFEIDSQIGNWAEDFLAKRNVAGNELLIGIHIGGRGGKRWGVENFAKVINWLTKEDYKVIIFWGREEKKMLPHLRRISNDKIIISDLLTLPKLAAVIKRCSLFISSDTGPMHLAVALKVSTLAIFIDSDAKKYGPEGDLHRILSGDVAADIVKSKLKEMLAESQPVLR